jgi:hypothetical protein
MMLVTGTVSVGGIAITTELGARVCSSSGRLPPPPDSERGSHGRYYILNRHSTLNRFYLHTLKILCTYYELSIDISRYSWRKSHI